MRKAALFVVVGGLFVVAASGVSLIAQTSAAPKYKFDPDWPKTMPNKWKIGGVTGLAVDKDDNVWVYDRPNDLRDMELKAELTPTIVDCCVRPPAMIHIDKAGNVIGSFDPPQGHGMAVDRDGFVYLGNSVKGLNTVRKYDPKTGQMLKEIPRAPETQAGAGGEDDEAPVARQPGRGGPGPTGTYPAQRGGGAGRGNAAAQQAAAAAFAAKYPPGTPMIVGQIEEVRLDEAARELYAADSSFGGRVMVFDLDTFAFKRGWGAYGHKLSEISTNEKDREFDGARPPKEFRGHLTLNVSNDGLVYAADRAAERIDVTKRDGTFVKEFILAAPGSKRNDSDRGAAGGVAFSPDKAQKFLYICDIKNNTIWFLNRDDGKIVGRLGSMGENGGQFFGLHMIATDSKGVIYTGEVFAGQRVQRFVPADSARGKAIEALARIQ
jgi:DNA-binding beta-propeller fold protein YncE